MNHLCQLIQHVSRDPNDERSACARDTGAMVNSGEGNSWHESYDKRTKSLVATVLARLGLRDKPVRASAIADAEWEWRGVGRRR